MSSQHDKIDLINLVHQPESVTKQIHPNQFFESCISALEIKRCEKKVVFQHGMNFIQETGKLLKLDCKLFENFLLAYVHHVTKEVIERLGVSFEGSAANTLIDLISYLHAFLGKVKSFTCFELPKIGFLLDSTLQILEECYNLCKQSHSQASLNASLATVLEKVLEICNSIQKFVIEIIANNLQVFQWQTEIDFFVISKVFNSLCVVGEHIGLLNLKSTTEIWKCISKLCSENCRAINEHHVFDISKPVRFLCNEIISCVAIVYQQTDEHSVQKLEKLLKINSFFLKIIAKFAADLGCAHFVGFDHVIEMYFCVMRCPVSLRDSTLHKLVGQYLIIGLKDIVNLTYNHQNFSEALFKRSIRTTRECEAFLSISATILENLIKPSNREALSIYFDGNLRGNILTAIIENIKKCNDIFVNKVLYETLIRNFVAFMVANCSNDRITFCEELLIKGILENNYMLGVFCIEVWVLLANFASSDTSLRYFDFWLKCYENRPVIVSEPKDVFIKILVCELYQLIPDVSKQEMSFNIRTLEDMKFISIMDFNTINEKISPDQLFSSLDKSFGQFQQSATSGLYYETAAKLETYKLSNRINGFENLLELITSQLCSNLKDAKYCVVLNSFLSFLSKNMHLISKEHISLITERLINTMDATTSSATKLRMLKLLSIHYSFTGNVSKIEEFLSKHCRGDNSETILAKNYLEFYVGQSFDDYRCLANLNHQILNAYFNELGEILINHECCERDAVHQIKGAKRHKTGGANPLLIKLMNDTKKVCESFKHIPPDDYEIQQIKEVLSNLEGLIKINSKQLL